MLQILIKSPSNHIDLNQCLFLCSELTMGEDYDDYDSAIV